MRRIRDGEYVDMCDIETKVVVASVMVDTVHVGHSISISIHALPCSSHINDWQGSNRALASARVRDRLQKCPDVISSASIAIGATIDWYECNNGSPYH